MKLKTNNICLKLLTQASLKPDIRHELTREQKLVLMNYESGYLRLEEVLDLVEEYNKK